MFPGVLGGVVIWANAGAATSITASRVAAVDFFMLPSRFLYERCFGPRHTPVAAEQSVWVFEASGSVQSGLSRIKITGVLLFVKLELQVSE
jgi:hypothetical protein